MIVLLGVLFLTIRRPPHPILTDTRLPATTRLRSVALALGQARRTLKGGGLHSLALFGKPKEVVAAQLAAERRDLDLPVAYGHARARAVGLVGTCHDRLDHAANLHRYRGRPDRKSTRLNSSH